ncbi:phosphoribosylglycinamide formyltransferase [bacterium]|nr:phosphoribosylglycinamide formyltransferase [bacterium]
MASGRGSNAEAILQACREGKLQAEGALVVSNNPDAGVHEVAARFDAASQTIARPDFPDGGSFAETLIGAFRDAGVELILLAGYMRKVPPALLREYRGAVLNIHPALLPRHGGKGMYGIHVHEDVLRERDRETGVTVHYVDEEYDRGPILLQKGGVDVRADDTPEALAERVLELEHRAYPEAVALWMEKHRSIV